MKIRTRFAPTPSGLLHWGNLYNFVLIWRYARLHQGSIVLRIDDLDRERTQTESIQDIFETLKFLGLDWDEGPRDLEDFERNFSQQLRMEEYFEKIKNLPHYVCDCSRAAIQARGFESYDGYCRKRGLSFSPNLTQIRFQSSEPKSDVVVWRKENLAAYHWVSVLEDERQKINLIIRGEDLFESSQIQKEIAKASGLKTFSEIKFIHHRLLLNETHQKLSKSEKAESIKSWRERGASREDIFRELSRRAQWPIVSGSLKEILENHTIDPST